MLIAPGTGPSRPVPVRPEPVSDTVRMPPAAACTRPTTTAEPSRAEPSRAEPSRAEPSRDVRAKAALHTAAGVASQAEEVKPGYQ